MEDISKYGLDLHCQMILEEYREKFDVFETMKDIVLSKLKECLDSNGILVTALEARVKKEASLAGKLELKGHKYASLDDLTDILGARVITFYSDEVDKIAAIAENIFAIDWENSVDKRTMHQLDSFGYNSLHYICRIPKSLYYDPEHPEINTIRFELQMRTALQHVWANMYHDTGYKSGVEIPKEYLRNLNRLAGMLELADEQFSKIRTDINEYRRQVQALVADGNFDEVLLNGDTFKSYLNLKPFDSLNQRIAAINQAEIHNSSLFSYLNALKFMNFKTLGDIERMRRDCSDDAYKLAVHQIGGTDLDIISSTIGIQNLCVVYLLKQGAGVHGLSYFFNALLGDNPYNEKRAQKLYDQAMNLPFMQKRS